MDGLVADLQTKKSVFTSTYTGIYNIQAMVSVVVLVEDPEPVKRQGPTTCAFSLFFAPCHVAESFFGAVTVHSQWQSRVGGGPFLLTKKAQLWDWPYQSVGRQCYMYWLDDFFLYTYK